MPINPVTVSAPRLRPTARRIEGPGAKARAMSAQGYRLEPMPAPYCYRVLRPRDEVVRDVTGDDVACYHVCIHPQRATCDCAWFGIHGERHACKHIHFCRLALLGAMRLISPVADMSDVLNELELS